MGILDDAGNLLNRGVASAGRTTRSISLKSQINDLNKRRETLMAQLGANLYDEVRNDPRLRAPNEGILFAVDNLDQQTAALQLELANLEAQAQVGAAGQPGMPGMITCPTCATQVSTGNAFCTGCGMSVAAMPQPVPPMPQPVPPMPQPIPPVPPVPQPMQQGTKLCPNCGFVLGEADRFCTNCGYSTPAPPAEQFMPSPVGQPDVYGAQPAPMQGFVPPVPVPVVPMEQAPQFQQAPYQSFVPPAPVPVIEAEAPVAEAEAVVAEVAEAVVAEVAEVAAVAEEADIAAEEAIAAVIEAEIVVSEADTTVEADVSVDTPDAEAGEGDVSAYEVAASQEIVAAQMEASEQPSEPLAVFCTSCGAGATPGAAFCTSCGTKL